MMTKETATPAARAAPVPLEGTPGQVAYGESVRRGMLAVLRRSAPPDVLELLYSVKDATWWIANRGKPLDAIRWPSPHQLAPGDPSSSTDGGAG